MTEAIDYHDREAKKFRKKYLEKKGFKFRLVVWNNLIRGTGKCVRSMDLGCGPGWMTKILCEVSESVVAIDGSDEMIRQSQGTLGRDVERVEFRKASITPQLLQSWVNGSFDLIISSSVLEYVPHAEKVLAGCYSLLGSKGTLIFSIPNQESLFRQLEGRLFRLFGKPAYRGMLINVWRRDVAIQRLKEMGFKIETIQFQGYIPIYSELFFWMSDRFKRPMMIIVAKK